MKPNYRIYPSLLDKFQKCLNAYIDAEGFWNLNPITGEPKLSAEELERHCEQELIDAINRTKHEPIEAADKGTCFNEIVDCLIMDKDTDRDDTIPYIKATLNGFDFLFDVALCKSAAEYFGPNAICQHPCKGYIQTAMGLVELYGYADEIVKDKVYDIKTTAAYSFGKYEQGWQKLVYPYCLVQSGEMPAVSSFEYTIFQLSKPSARNPIIKGTMYKEEYTYDHDYAQDRLRSILEIFIVWLEGHKDKISDKKIFGAEVCQPYMYTAPGARRFSVK